MGSDTAQLGVNAVKKAAGGALFVHSAEVMSGTIKKGAQVRGQRGGGREGKGGGAAGRKVGGKQGALFSRMQGVPSVVDPY